MEKHFFLLSWVRPFAGYSIRGSAGRRLRALRKTLKNSLTSAAYAARGSDGGQHLSSCPQRSNLVDGKDGAQACRGGGVPPLLGRESLRLLHAVQVEPPLC